MVKRADLFAAVLVLFGFVLRLWKASGTFFDPDEAMHVIAAIRPTLAAAYQASLRLAHPPLLILLLHFWQHLGRPELMLRLPSVIAGTIFCWAFYRWLGVTLGGAAALTGLIFACFLPPMIELSAEVRQYALLLGFMMLASWWLEEALRRSSAGRMILPAACLYLAMLSHFSGILFAGALGAYGLLRLAGGNCGKRVLAAWIATQAGAVAILAFLYKVQIARLRTSEMAREAMGGTLAASYFHWGSGHWPAFVFARSFGVFQYVFGQLAVGDLAGLVFLGGAAVLLKKRASEEPAHARPLAIFLLLPFVITCAAALADLYPYGGTRHSAYLAPFALAGASYGLVRWLRGRVVPALAASFAIVVVCAGVGHPHRPYMTRDDQRRAHMSEAVSFLRQNVEPGQPILIDFQSFFPVHYYFCHDVPPLLGTPFPEFIDFSCAGTHVIAANPRTNIWDRQSFLQQWPGLVQAYGLRPDQTVWVLQMGWDIDLGQQLQAMPEFHDLKVEYFGRNIQAFRLRVGQAAARAGEIARNVSTDCAARSGRGH